MGSRCEAVDLGRVVLQRQPLTRGIKACIDSATRPLSALAAPPGPTLDAARSTQHSHRGGGGETVGWLLREIMALLNPRFPPAALCLDMLAEGKMVTDAECACLVQCLWGLAREMVPAGLADTRVLESSRTFLSWLVSRASSSRADTQRTRSRELAMKQLGSAAAAVVVAPGVSSNVVVLCGLGDVWSSFVFSSSHAFAAAVLG